MSPSSVIFDLDGVLWWGDQPMPDAAAVVARLRSGGFRVGFCTNNSTRHRRDVAAKLTRLGMPATPDDVLTAGALAAAIVSKRYPGRPVLCVGEDGLRSELAEVGVALAEDPGEATAVVLGLDRSVDFARLRDAHRAIVAGAAFIATNPDVTLPEDDGGSCPGCGALIAALERSTGVRAECLGKPEPTLFSHCASRWGVHPADVAIVGDRLDTDIVAANRFGGMGILALTGMTSLDAATASTGESRPCAIIESLADLPRALGLGEAGVVS
jgi:HAD superfamily hydrolase (TIGR01450 family)